MDKVRLGKVLGAGARHAARTAYSALDAAMAPDPNPPASSPARKDPPASTQPRPSASDHLATAARTVQRVQDSKKQAKQAAFAPIKKAGKTLWLEITGSFFLLFGLSFAFAALKLRDAIHTAGPARNNLLIFAGLAAVFLYFGISSFLRARKK